MSYQNDIQHRTATLAIQALNTLGTDTSTAEEPITRWNRVREAVRNLQKPDASPLWDAIAADDQKKVTKAATDYMTSQAIKEAAKADTHREDTYRAEALSIIKRLIIDAQPTARDAYNDHAETYMQAFRDANNHPEPSELIVNDHGSDIWRDLIDSAQGMTRAANVIKLAAEFGYRVNDEGSGLGAQVPYCTGLPTITAYEEAKASNDWLNTRPHGAHKEWALFLLAGGTLQATDLDTQRAEVERLIEQAQDGRKQKMIPDIMNNDQRALRRAMKTAQKAGRA
jgi:hypothetical protein